LHYVDFRYSEGDSASQAVVGLGPRDEALATLDLTRLDELRMLGRLKEYGQALTEAFFAAVRLRSRGGRSAGCSASGARVDAISRISFRRNTEWCGAFPEMTRFI
jgi:hypothetical protein